MTTRQHAPVAAPATMNNKLVKYDSATGTLVDGSALAGGTFIVDSVASDIIVNNSTTYVSTTLAFAVGANETWQFTALVHYDGATAADIKFQQTVPASTTWLTLVDAVGTGAASVQTNVNRAPIGSGGTLATGVAVGAAGIGAGTRLAAVITGHVRTAGTAGTVALNFAQSVADPTDTTVYAGSSLIAVRVA